jgi:hypothetical protein
MDIQMPDLTGLQLSKIERKPLFYDRLPQFALQSYEVDAIDYLLNHLNLNVLKQY